MALRIPLLQSCGGSAQLICADLSRVLNVSVVEFNAFVNRLGDPHGLPHSPTHSLYVELTKSSYQWKLTNASSSYPLVCQSREYICSMLLQAPAVCRLSSGVATGGGGKRGQLPQPPQPSPGSTLRSAQIRREIIITGVWVGRNQYDQS